jgi:hypothetical protein
MRTRRAADVDEREPRSPPPPPRVHSVLALQRSAGNHAVATLLQRTRLSHGPVAVARFDDAKFEEGLDLFARATKKMDFSGSGSAPRYDKDNWTCLLVLTKVEDGPSQTVPYEGQNGTAWKKIVDENHEVELQYVLKSGVKPSFAIREIPKKPAVWAMDCIDYVVAARLYAELRGSGDEAFDAKYANLGTEISPQPLRMAQHATPGLSSRDFWVREAQGAEFASRTKPENPTGVKPKDAGEEDVFLRTVPIGARVMWTTTHEKAAADMENENTIKVGDDKYAAHPLGRLSGANVREELIAGPDEDDESKHAAHIAAYIYLSEVEWYDRH